MIGVRLYTGQKESVTILLLLMSVMLVRLDLFGSILLYDISSERCKTLLEIQSGFHKGGNNLTLLTVLDGYAG